ncbi:MAG: hypothetical protein FWB85_05935 [Chitinispirillia bacterium]|nr:hypothetical protein [Chitinispirillia bacterium]
MIAISDAEDPIALRAAGIRLLNEGLGSEKAREFMGQCFDGWGDSLAEKKTHPLGRCAQIY